VLQELNPVCGQRTSVGSLSSLIWLTLGAFAIGTEGFMIAGLLPALARDLNVGLPAAGHLVTAFSLAYAIGAPVMAVLTAGLERRRLLAVAMGGCRGEVTGVSVNFPRAGQETLQGMALASLCPLCGG
jgi:MFS family permease